MKLIVFAAALVPFGHLLWRGYNGDLTADGFNLFPSSFTGLHTGGGIVTLSSVGLNPGLPAAPADARGAMSATKLHDGSVLFLGGSKGTTTTSIASGYVYTPDP